MPSDNSDQEEIAITITLPRDILEWIDGIRDMLGLEQRGPIVSQLLRELLPSTEHGQEPLKTQGE